MSICFIQVRLRLVLTLLTNFEILKKKKKRTDVSHEQVVVIIQYLILKAMRKNSPSELLSTITDVAVLTVK